MSKKDWRPDQPDYNSDSPPDLDEFVRGYLEAALWSSIDQDGEPLERNYYLDDFSWPAIRDAVKECDLFRREAGDLLDATGAHDSTNAFDFWLTRNHHGAGFWDRGYGEIGDRLTRIARSYGEVDLYVGDDGLLYFA